MDDREINLLKILGRVKSSSDRERAKALADIRQIFRHNEHSQRIDNLSDDTWHSLFEALFECTRTERALFLRNTKGSKAQVETRLESCGSTLRLVVEAGASRLRSKTVRALIDHILETLPTSDGFCAPLSINYLKALRIILEYQPHVEHLREFKKDSSNEFKEWSEVIEFCVDAISYYVGQADSGASDTPQSLGRSLLRTSLASADFSVKSAVAEPAPRTPSSSRSAVQLEELVSCVRCLTKTPNAPVVKKASAIIDAIVIFLQNARSVGRAHHDAVSAINFVLARIVPQSIGITQKAIQQLLPLFKELWLSKSPTFRDEILATLILTKSHVLHMLKNSADKLELATHLEGLLQVLVLEYCRRLEREQLAVDDLTFSGKSSQAALCNSSFRLRSGNVQGESSWAQIELIAFYASALDSFKNPHSSDADEYADQEQISAKRARVSSHLDDFLRQAVYGSGSSKLGSLHILAFMMLSAAFTVVQLETAIDRLTNLLTTEKGSVSSWAALSMASCAFQKSSADESLQAIWEKVAQLSLKLVSSVSSCRAACHLLDIIIQFRLVSSTALLAAIDSILSSTDLAGPAVLAESSMALWSTLLRLKTEENPSSATLVSDRALNWLFTKFTPSKYLEADLKVSYAYILRGKFDEKGLASQSGMDFGAIDVLWLVSRCINRRLCADLKQHFRRFGIIGQAWQRTFDFKGLVDYLVLREETFTPLRTLPDDDSSLDFIGTQARPSLTASRLVADFCCREVNNCIEKWQQLAADRTKSITPLGIRLVACLCLVSDAVAASIGSRSTNEVDRLIDSTATLAKEVAAFAAAQDCDQRKVDALYDLVASSLPDMAKWSAISASGGMNPQSLSFLLQLSTAFETRSKTQESVQAREIDLMDLDEGFDSQASNGHHKNIGDPRPRDLSSLTDDNAFQTCVSQYLVLLSRYVEALTANDSPSYVPSSFVERLTDQPAETFCAGQPLVELMFSSLSLQPSSIEALVDYVGENFLEDYVFNRNEVALTICVDLLSHFAAEWTDSRAASLCEAAGEIYHWFVSAALPKNLCSTDVKQRLIGLFYQLLKARGPEYRGPDNDQSIRTYIFTLLKSNTLLVIRTVSQNISDFFNCFILGEHENVFNDLYKNISQRVDWMEGLAMRLFVLAELGSRWPTLLRRCLYHIFETAGYVEETSGHATFCVYKIAKAVGLDESRDLFRLFAPQLIYTWLGVQTLATIPFSIFQYRTLDQLLRDVQDEALPQALMRGKDTEVTFLTETIGSSSEDILKSNATFAKSAAYCISWDADNGGAERKSASSENNLTALLGKKKYVESLTTHLPYILCTLLSTVEQDHHIAKSLGRRSSTQAAATIFNEILKISSSTYTLPADQQPSFSAKTLLDRMETLCHRLGMNETRLWTASIYVFVLRMLLSRIQPALGSLHACSTIRKIRTLIALAGPVALSGYAVEMALQSLIPFTTDKQCAEDSLGIVQYLLHHGAQYLAKDISSVTGLVVSVLVSLRKFVGSSQESTTQESQHLATMEKAQNFHNWLSKQWLPAFVSELRKQNSKDVTLESFADLVKAAADAQAESNAIDGTVESGLLLQILKETQNSKPLLRKSMVDLIIRSFCSQFRPSPAFRSDILGRDELAEAYAKGVWRSIRIHGVSGQFQLWSARVLGRAYNASGASHFLLDSRPSAESTKMEPNDPEDLAHSSKAVIFECLQDLLTSSNCREAGLTEDTIRMILSRSKSDMAYIQRMLPTTIVNAFLSSAADFIEHIASSSKSLSLNEALSSYTMRPMENWLQVVCISLANKAFLDPVIQSLVRLLRGIPRLAERLFTPILHLVLLSEYEHKQDARAAVSAAFKSLFGEVGPSTVSHAKAALKAIIYLRKQPVPKENTEADRELWLEIDHVGAARAAEYCHLHSTALLLAETTTPSQNNTQRGSRRSSAPVQPTIPDDLLLSIYKNIDEPDSYYGVQQDSSLASVLNRLDYEGEGFKSLLFRGAQADSEMRRLHNISANNAGGLISALNYLNLNSLTNTLLSNEQFHSASSNIAGLALETARKLDQWDIRASRHASSEPSIIYAVLQGISNATTAGEIRRRIDQGFSNALRTMTSVGTSPELMRAGLRTLGILTEIDDVMASLSRDDLEDVLGDMERRGAWMQSAQVKDVRPIISTRQTVFGLLSSHDTLQSILHLKAKDAREKEVQNILTSCKLSKQLQASQELLVSATYLSDIVPVCESAGLHVAEEAQQLMAEVLWDQGEKSTSIRMLQQVANAYPDSATKTSGKAILLAQLGHRVAEARLEQPVDIMDNYLDPAVEELRGDFTNPDAGNVLHEFAAFCDKQLSNREEELEVPRLRRARDQREKEVLGLTELIKSKSKSEARRLESALVKAKKWFTIENNEYQRLKNARESYLSQSLKNYLLSLSCSNEHDNDVLRFFSIWLEFAQDDLANNSVKEVIEKVPSAKFVVLINQLTSRLQAEKSEFQDLLTRLIIRICTDHPHHAMHNIFAAIQSYGSSMDDAAKSRITASKAVANILQKEQKSSKIWKAINFADGLYHQLAVLKDEGNIEPSRQVRIEQYTQSKAILKIKDYKVPPPTLSIPLRADMDYSKVPVVVGFHNYMRIANGLSAPKIVTALVSDGSRFKQLFKGGSDDLRQDMIMEQVFEQASKLLKNHTATRQRNLRIRTYNVLPLSARSGIMEFVQNTIALNDALMPAHEAYYPKDMKPRAARAKITEAHNLTAEARVKEFRKVCEQFHPVMRYFFLERFLDPDEWFEKRLAYTRTTAAISILGHVLGLGDRHCHNILLDERTGEVVHIDLGVAFEAGRALPIPEVVPFRLTRDLVDGMGINKTEGVFRRCCEFTLEALREERESIMTVLNVLRYDPLYSWTVSPLRAKRMQESEFGGSRDPSRAPSRAPDDGVDVRDVDARKDENEVGEAERALTVVEKKLSKSLSTTATVSELIQQATDERNLAVLFSGWAAYA